MKGTRRMKVVDFEEVIYLLGKHYMCDNQIADLIEKETFEIPEWIKAADKLPEPYEDVLVYGQINKTNNLTRYKVDYTDDRDVFVRSTKVTHWMPLPEPPKENEE